MHSASPNLATVTRIASTLQQEFGLGGAAISPELTIFEMGFESLHLVELMLSLSERFGEDVIERLEIDANLSLQALARQIDAQLGGKKAGWNDE